MNKEFIPYKQALELKELGFDEPCVAFYYKDLDNIYQKYCESFLSNDDAYCCGEKILCAAPLYQQAFRFFREKYGFFIQIFQYIDTKEWDFNIYWDSEDEDFLNEPYPTYEEAELECLKKLIEIVKNNDTTIS